MPLFNATAIAQLRGLNKASLTSRAKIERPAAVASAGGGANTGKRAWEIVDDAVPARLTTMEAVAVTLQAGQLTTPERLLVVLDLEGAPVRPGDRITVTDTDAAGGDWTRVVLVLSPRTPRTYSAMRVFVCQDAGPGSV